MVEAVLVVFITLVLSSIAYLLRPDILPLRPSKNVDSLPEESRHLYATISIDEAIDRFKQQSAVFADARPLETFLQGHIEGAIHLDPSEFDTWSEPLIERTPLETNIITYCEGEHCSLSAELAEKLTWLGYEHVFYLKDGWGQWKRLRLPVGQGS
jgi:rhodanese-related sulfurtransferase